MGEESSIPRRRAWREVEFWLLAWLVIVLYGGRLTTLTLRGEEPRRAQISQEMIRSGDWLVPRLHGAVFPSRPPLSNWAIAASAKIFGDLELAAIRLPSVLAVLLTTLATYGYARLFLSPLGSLTAGAAYATMLQVLELGRMAETEALFTFFVSASWMGWHTGYTNRWPPAIMWTAGYALAALGALTKGLQAPVYFVGTVGIYLAWRRQWRVLFSPAHAAGIAVFIVMVGAWLIPFWLEAGWGTVLTLWLGEALLHSRITTLADFFSHLLVFPVWLWACMLPWSAFLIFASRLKNQNAEIQPMIFFLGTAVLIGFASVWIPANGRPRYFMPLYPCVAALVGVIVQRGYESKCRPQDWRLWVRFLRGCAFSVAALGGGLLVLNLAGFPAGRAWSQPALFAGFYALTAAAVSTIFIGLIRNRSSVVWWRAGVISLALFAGASYTGVMINKLVNTSVDTRAAVERLKEKLPPGTRLVSLGPVASLFLFHYRAPVSLVESHSELSAIADEKTYFCFDRFFGREPPIPFEWDEVAVISVARFQSLESHFNVVVGKRRMPRGDER